MPKTFYHQKLFVGYVERVSQRLCFATTKYTKHTKTAVLRFHLDREMTRNDERQP